MSALLSTVTFAVEIFPRFAKEITKMNISCGYPMILLHTSKMDIEPGFTSRFMEYRKESSSLSHLKI